MRNKKKILISLGIVALILLGIVAGSMAIDKRWNPMQGLADDEEEEYDNILYIGDDEYIFDHHIETFLFVGTDASQDKDYGDHEYHGSMADSILVMVIDYTDDSYGFLQVDRNTITSVTMIDPSGETLGFTDEQICTAHWYGADPRQSAENTVDAVKMVMGEIEDIDGYYVLDMDKIGLLNASVGGVEVTFDIDMTEVDPSFKKGATILLSDEQAEKYLRARMVLDDDTNASRMSRHRVYLDAFFAKAAKMVRNDPGIADNLWKSLRDFAVTDLTGRDFSRIAEALWANESKGILTYEGETRLGYIIGDGEEHEEFYPSEESVAHVLTDLLSLKKIEDEE